ncbi:MAG: hypothetical protein PGN07_00435 [Aeromicrobium erythreum]
MSAPTVERHWFALLTPRETTAIMLEGLDVVGGPVVPLEEATYADADAARAAFGHPDPEPGRGRFVDFLVLPELPGVHVEDGVLRPTRAPSGAEFWRLEDDGRRRVISYYDTPAYGWRNGRGPVAPAERPGLRARWNGLDLVAAFEEGVDGVHLVAVGDEPPEGFTWTKLGVSRRTVGLDEVELYEA